MKQIIFINEIFPFLFQIKFCQNIIMSKRLFKGKIFGLQNIKEATIYLMMTFAYPSVFIYIIPDP